ncbi:hypothetical protein BDZ85DRAFT_89769 [Elsinoe ampelina]|uniref:Nucleoside phosphorylase domain-containing protein n=1 Tax=Elsinoe ampelina TaxID=302913 RepID=A0A6A6GI84_9PEZI|nr:hypothetical protein BDZ85DRAFT_89769 [Elsinoe ampelina]
MATLLRYEDYTIAWIAVLPVEAEAAVGMLDRRHEGRFPMGPGNKNLFIGGEIYGHNVVIATWPRGQTYGIGAAAELATDVKRRFRKIWFALLVGVAAGIPHLDAGEQTKDIRLGDVLVCVPDQVNSGIVQYDYGKWLSSDSGVKFVPNGRQAETESVIRTAISYIDLTTPSPFEDGNESAEHLRIFQARQTTSKFICPSQDDDILLATRGSDSTGVVSVPIERTRRAESHRTYVWYGRMGSGNALVKSARKRDELRDEHGIIGLEMEAAGTMNILPAGVIRGVCDYADRQKDKRWQPYAAATAAAYAKSILKNTPLIQTKTATRSSRTPRPSPVTVVTRQRRHHHRGRGIPQSIRERLESIPSDDKTGDADAEESVISYNHDTMQPTKSASSLSTSTLPSRALHGSTKPKDIDVLPEDSPLVKFARSYQLHSSFRTSPPREFPSGNASSSVSAHCDAQSANKRSKYQSPTVEDETPSAPAAIEPKKEQQSLVVPDGTIDAVSPLDLQPTSQETPDQYSVKNVREVDPQYERARTTDPARADTDERRKEPRASTIRAKQVVADHRFVLATFDRYSPGPGIGTLPDDFPKPDMSWQLPPKAMDDTEEIDTAQDCEVVSLHSTSSAGSVPSGFEYSDTGAVRSMNMKDDSYHERKPQTDVPDHDKISSRRHRARWRSDNARWYAVYDWRQAVSNAEHEPSCQPPPRIPPSSPHASLDPYASPAKYTPRDSYASPAPCPPPDPYARPTRSGWDSLRGYHGDPGRVEAHTYPYSQTRPTEPYDPYYGYGRSRAHESYHSPPPSPNACEEFERFFGPKASQYGET